MHRFRVAFLIALSVFAAVVIAACGGSDGGGEDPQTVLDDTFNNDQKVTSGSFDVSFNVDAEGGDDPGSVEASLSGPFQSGEDGAVPQFDLTAEAKVNTSSQDFTGSAGLISTGDKAFVNFQDTDYEVPADIFQQFSSSFAQASQQQGQDKSDNFLSSIGIDPSSWLTDLSNEGDEDVNGTETIHISGQADVPKLIADLKTIVQKVPQASSQISPAQLSQFDQISSLVKTADFDIFTGKDDNVLRKLEANIEVDPPDTSGAPDSVKLNFSIGFKDVNDPQTISAPTGAQPLSSLLQQFGVDPSALGSLGSAIGADSSSDSAGPGATPPGGGSAASQAYLDCLGKAQGAAAIQQCAALLGQ